MTFRELVQTQEIIVAPGAYDAVSALLVERAGFPVAYITGLVNEASDLGFPDLGLTTASEIVRRASTVVGAVGVPVVCDADTGFGGALNVHRTVRMFEAAGVGGVHIEDQTFPKRCGALAGKRVIVAEDFARRIRVAADARRTKDFVLIARTDAEALGIDEVIRRLNLYVENGADMGMLGGFYSLEASRRIAREVRAPLVVCASDPSHFDCQPDYSVDDMRAAGVRMLIYWHLPLFAAMKGVERALVSLRERGTAGQLAGDLSTYDEYAEVLGLARWLELGD